jgi:ferredoxin
VRIRVDRALCQGHAMCNMTAPDVYQLDDLGYNAFDGDVEIADDLADAARRGALACPERAITIVDEPASPR